MAIIEGRGAYQAAKPRVRNLGTDETVNSAEKSRYILVGPEEQVLNFCRSKFNDPDPKNVHKASSLRQLEAARSNPYWRGAAIILVPGWARKAQMHNETVMYVLATFDGVG